MIKIKRITTTNAGISSFSGVSGRVVNITPLSVNTLAQLCSENNTVTRADALAVLNALFIECRHALKNGYTVSLGDLGTLHLTISSKLASTLDDWNVNDNLKRVNVRYTPSVAIRRAINISAPGITFKVL